MATICRCTDDVEDLADRVAAVLKARTNEAQINIYSRVDSAALVDAVNKGLRVTLRGGAVA